MDKYSKEIRSYMMSSVKSKGTKLEEYFGKILWRNGIRYRKNSSKLPGKPDFSISKYEIAIFIDSCYWHGCKKHCRMPKSNKKFWTQKIERNIERDKEINRLYRKQNWNLFRIWEHDLQNGEKIDSLLKEIKTIISSKKKS